MDKFCLYILAAIVSNTIVRWLPNNAICNQAYFIGQSLSYVFVGLALWVVANTGLRKLIVAAYLICVVNNFIDELIFNPIVFGWNEVLFIGGGIIITYSRIKRCQAGKSKLLN